MRVLHCPDIVGGNAGQLARAERELGLDSMLVAFKASPFNYPADRFLLSAHANILQRQFARWRLLWIALSFDVIHYNFGQSIMPSRFSLADGGGRLNLLRKLYSFYADCVELLDVRILKALGKKIVVTYQGDDARQGDYCRENFDITFAHEVGDDYYNSVTDQLKRERIAKFSKYANRIFALNPDLLHVLPKNAKFLPYSNIDLREWKPTSPINFKPVIVHAPSHRGAKGTRFIVQAVAQLRSKGLEFEFVLVEGMTHQEARKQYEGADLLIDQLLAGWYGGLAVELMALGKPVICYIREGDLGYIPGEMRADLPIINATPSSIADVLEHWLTEGFERLPAIGRKSRQYVEKWHDPLRIAAFMKKEYEAVLKVI